MIDTQQRNEKGTEFSIKQLDRKMACMSKFYCIIYTYQSLLYVFQVDHYLLVMIYWLNAFHENGNIVMLYTNWPENNFCIYYLVVFFFVL